MSICGCSRSRFGVSTVSTNGKPPIASQRRYATALRRPKRPWTFNQLVTLSDGSTFTQRTTSPVPVLVSAKDRVNHPLWNPSLQSLKNREEDEAGRLAAFRERYGMGFESDNPKIRRAAAIAAERSGTGSKPLDTAVQAEATQLPVTGRSKAGSNLLGDEPISVDEVSGGVAVDAAAGDAEAKQRNAGRKAPKPVRRVDDGGLMDLISGYSSSLPPTSKTVGSKVEQSRGISPKATVKSASDLSAKVNKPK